MKKNIKIRIKKVLTTKRIVKIAIVYVLCLVSYYMSQVGIKEINIVKILNH